jgi:mono/diheme cytochrome c family protein
MKLLLGALVAILVLIGAALVVIYSGTFNVAATSTDGPVLSWLLSTTRERSIRAHADDGVKNIPADPAAVLRGLKAFEEMCVVCHGAPGVDRGWMGQGMNPQPPDLAEEAAEYSASEVHWILSNGIKMAGMPALSPTHSDVEIRELVAFVERLPGMSASDYRQLRDAQPEARADTNVDDGHKGHSHTH